MNQQEPALLNTLDKEREVRTRHSYVNLCVEVGFERTADLERMAPDVEGTPGGSTACSEKEEKKEREKCQQYTGLDFLDLGDCYFEPGFLKNEFKCY